MFKKKLNWRLYFVVAVVSICSLLLIQQYVMAQGWVDPNSLPGQTPDNVFVVNPMTDDLYLNNKKILGTNIDIKSANDDNVIVIKNQKNLCLTRADGTLNCKSDWPTVTGGVRGGGTAGKIPIFTASDLIDNSSIKHLGGNQYSINGDSQSGGLVIENNGTYNPLDLKLWAFFGSTYNGINISNIGEGGSIKISDSNTNITAAAQARSSIYIDNNSYGSGLYIKQRNATTTSPGRALRVDDSLSDSTPFVIDWDGRVGIGTANPNKNLHIDTGGVGNAEIDLQSIGGINQHWAIYHNNGAGATFNGLVFWKDGANRMAFTSAGNILLSGQVCDMNGLNCFSGSTNYWTQDASLNLSRTNSNVYLVANGQPLPVAATGASNRFVWYPNKLAIRAGGVSGAGAAYWDDAYIGTGSIAFGSNSMARSNYSTVSGGDGNTISDASGFGLDATIGGGYNNQIIKSIQGTIAGGGSNRIGTGLNEKNAAFIGGGVGNLNNGSIAVIAGGSRNSINDGENSVIGGGYQNVISSWWSFIGGGASNDSVYPSYGSFGYNFIGGGSNNTTTAAYASIVGGYWNSTAGQYATVLGGSSNKADGDYSVAGGRNMQLSLTADNSFVWGNYITPTSITRDNSFIIFPVNPAAGSVPRVGIGTANPNSTLHVKSNSGNAEIDIQSGSSPYWGIYQDDTSDELRFWYNSANKIIFNNNGLGVVNASDAVYNYIQLDQLDSATPPVTDCDVDAEVGRMFWKDVTNRLVVCGTGGWKEFVPL